MRGELSQETPVAVPATVIWEVYRGLELGRLVDQLLGDTVGKVEVVEGDGGVGTIVKVTFPPGTPGAGYMKEKFTRIDEENRIKEIEIFEGGYIALGFDSCRVRLEIIETDSESSIIRSTVMYEADEKLADVASTINTKPLEAVAQVIGKYLSDIKASSA